MVSEATFLPTTPAELRQRGWDALDVILVSGDAYIDSPFSGIALIGRTLEAAGLRVGIIAQPDTESLDDIRRLGAPRLFLAVDLEFLPVFEAFDRVNFRIGLAADFHESGGFSHNV